MNEWKKVKLKELIKEVNERNKDEKVKRVLSVTNSQGFVEQKEYFEGTVHSANLSNYKIVRKNQFAYNPSRVNVGSIDILKDYEYGALSPMYIVFEVDNTKLLPDYFKYYFQTNRFFENVKNNAQGSVRNSLSFKALADFDYLLPPIDEQEKIVKILRDTDSIIEKYKLLLEEKKQFIKAQFVDIFKNKNKKIVHLSDLLEFKNGINASADKYGKGIKYISIMDILNNSYIKYDFIKGQVEIDENQLKIYSVSYGDVIFVRSSENYEDTGKSSIYVDTEKDAAFGGFAIRGKKIGEYNPYYLNMALKMPKVRRQFQRYAVGNQHVNIGQESLKKIQIEMCDIEDQNKYEKIYKLLDAEKSKIKEMIINYKNLKKALMQKLLTGKVKVNV